MKGRVVDVLFVILDVEITLDNSAVLQTQVGEQVLALRQQGLRAGVLCTVQDVERFRKVIGEQLLEADVAVWTVEHRSLARNLLALSRTLRAVVQTADVGRAYARTIWGALVIQFATRGQLPYVYDVRGALAEETTDKGSARWKARVFTHLERRAVQRARHVSAVSSALAADICRRYRIRNVCVVPSCVKIQPLATDGTVRAAVRRAAGFPADAIVLVYSGGLNYYQQVPEMLNLWERMQDDPRVHFLLMTSTTPHVGERAFEVGRFGARLVHRSVPQKEVHDLLAVADVGFLLRQPLPLNAVASPVKVAEYLMAGLALAISPEIGDISARVEPERIGIVIPSEEESAAEDALRRLIDAVANDRAGYRGRARSAAQAYYDWGAYAPVFQRFYGRPSIASAKNLDPL